MQMTRSSTKRESWRLVDSLRGFRVPKQQERALAEVILNGIAQMLNVTFSTRTFALLLTLLEAIAVWNALLFQEQVSQTYPRSLGIPMNYFNDASEAKEPVIQTFVKRLLCMSRLVLLSLPFTSSDSRTRLRCH
jgi:hypothetical protein